PRVIPCYLTVLVAVAAEAVVVEDMDSASSDSAKRKIVVYFNRENSTVSYDCWIQQPRKSLRLASTASQKPQASFSSLPKSINTPPYLLHRRPASSIGSESDDEDASRLNTRDHVQRNSRGFADFRVKRIGQHQFGRREIDLVEQEMGGLMTLRKKAAADQPLAGARILVCIHINAQTAVFIETLLSWGPRCAAVPAISILPRMRPVAAALAEADIPIFAWRGESDEDFWWCIEQCIETESWSANLILDDGGDATNRMSKQFPALFRQLRGNRLRSQSLALYQMCSREPGAPSLLPCPAINLCDSVVKPRFDTYYMAREGIIDGLKRTTDVMLAGKTVCVCGYGYVGKGCSQALRQMAALCLLRRWIRSALCRLHGRLSLAAFCATWGHSNTEIDMSALQDKRLTWERVRSTVDHIIFPDGRRIILLAEGRLINMSCISFSSMVVSVTSCTPRRIRSQPSPAYAGRSQLTELNDDQARYLGVNKAGPFKPHNYKY
uniref:AdoHcyase_NAD domain-containing protein n=1 Tax=Macrostomum lignano TaxID=282301 RepID=A0A1I8F7V7_9PLAT